MRKASVVTLLAAMAVTPAAPAFAADGVPVSVDSVAAVDVENQSGTERLNAIIKAMEGTPLITPVLKDTVYHPESEAALVEQLNSETAASLEIAMADWGMQESHARSYMARMSVDELNKLIDASQVTTAVEKVPSFSGDENYQLGVLSANVNTMVMEVASGEDLAYAVTATKSGSVDNTWDFTSEVTKGSPELPGAYFVYEVAPGGSIKVTNGFAATNLQSPSGEATSADVLNNTLDQPIFVLVGAVNGTQVTGSGLTLPQDQTSPITIATVENQFPELTAPEETYVDYTLHVVGDAPANPDTNGPDDSIPEEPEPAEPVAGPYPAAPSPTEPTDPEGSVNPDNNNPGDSIPEKPEPTPPTDETVTSEQPNPAPTEPAEPEGPMNPDTNNPGDSIPEKPEPPRTAIGNPNPSQPQPTDPPVTEEAPVDGSEEKPAPEAPVDSETPAPEESSDTTTGEDSNTPGETISQEDTGTISPNEDQTVTEDTQEASETPATDVTETTTVEEHITDGISDEVKNMAENSGAKLPVVTDVNTTDGSSQNQSQSQTQQQSQDRKVLIETALDGDTHPVPAPAQIVIGGLGLLAAMVLSGIVINRKKSVL